MRWTDRKIFGTLFFSSILFDIGGGLSMPALMALTVYKGKEIDAMGSLMALITTAHSLGMLTGSLAAGLIMDMFRLREAFYSGAGIMAPVNELSIRKLRGVRPTEFKQKFS